jgi:hypothetical protein
MTGTRNRLRRARKYLEAFAESWKLDHAVAMDCCDFEEHLTEAVRVFELVDDLVRLRRACVFRGVEEPNTELDQAERELYEGWLRLIEEDVGQLEELERTFGTVEGMDAFRACQQRARSFLANWAPAILAKAIGSRMIEFSEEDADQLRALLEAPPGSSGRPKLDPRSIPIADASQLH